MFPNYLKQNYLQIQIKRIILYMYIYLFIIFCIGRNELDNLSFVTYKS